MCRGVWVCVGVCGYVWVCGWGGGGPFVTSVFHFFFLIFFLKENPVMFFLIPNSF